MRRGRKPTILPCEMIGRAIARPRLSLLGAALAIVGLAAAAMAQSTIFRASLTHGLAGTPANGSQVSMSADGNLVAFASTTQIAPEDTNTSADIYVRNITTGATTLVSLSLDGLSAANADCSSPAISANGRYVAFVSAATN